MEVRVSRRSQRTDDICLIVYMGRLLWCFFSVSRHFGDSLPLSCKVYTLLSFMVDFALTLQPPFDFGTSGLFFLYHYTTSVPYHKRFSFRLEDENERKIDGMSLGRMERILVY